MPSCRRFWGLRSLRIKGFRSFGLVRVTGLIGVSIQDVRVDLGFRL